MNRKYTLLSQKLESQAALQSSFEQLQSEGHDQGVQLQLTTDTQTRGKEDSVSSTGCGPNPSSVERNVMSIEETTTTAEVAAEAPKGGYIRSWGQWVPTVPVGVKAHRDLQRRERRLERLEAAKNAPRKTTKKVAKKATKQAPKNTDKALNKGNRRLSRALEALEARGYSLEKQVLGVAVARQTAAAARVKPTLGVSAAKKATKKATTKKATNKAAPTVTRLAPPVPVATKARQPNLALRAANALKRAEAAKKAAKKAKEAGRQATLRREGVKTLSQHLEALGAHRCEDRARKAWQALFEVALVGAEHACMDSAAWAVVYTATRVKASGGKIAGPAADRLTAMGFVA
jgi:hypothetical protein